jgi:MFS family permease
MFLLLFSGIFFGVYLASVYKTLAIDIEDSALTIAGAIGSVCNGGSRIIWATIQDYYGFKKVYLCLLVIQLITSIVIVSVRS